MKKLLSFLITLVIVLSLFAGCAPNYTEFCGVIMGGYSNYITISTLDERVDFYDANISVDVSTLNFKVEYGRAVRVTIKSRETDEFGEVKIIPAGVELIEYEVKYIDEAEALELFNNGAIPVDARSKDEFEMGHIPSAVCLTFKNMEKNYKTVLPNKDTPVVVYARSEETAKLTAQHLICFGYTKVYSLGKIDKYTKELEI